jgi:hypothetical protein
MPSIDLVRLRAEARELAGSLNQPDGFQARLRAMMESYAHRRLRRGRSMAYRGGLPAWEVSGILLRELDSALRPNAIQNAVDAIRCADAIWQDGRLEERILAVRLLGYGGQEVEIRARLAIWLYETEDPTLLMEMAEHACAPLRKGTVDAHRADIRQWIESSRLSAKWFGWLALHAWLREGSDSARWTAIDLLVQALSENNADILRTAAEITSQMFTSNTSEMQKWLDDLPSPTVLMGRSFFLAVVLHLPEEKASAIRKRLAEAAS